MNPWLPPSPPKTEVVPKTPAAAEKTDGASVRVSVENLNRLTGFAGECLVEVKMNPLIYPYIEYVTGEETVCS